MLHYDLMNMTLDERKTFFIGMGIAVIVCIIEYYFKNKKKDEDSS